MLFNTKQNVERRGASGRSGHGFLKSSVISDEFPVLSFPASRRYGVDSRGRNRTRTCVSCLRVALRTIAPRFRRHNRQSGAAFYQEFSGRRGALDRLRRPDLEVLSAKAGVRTGPGLKAAQAIHDFLSRTSKINLAIFFLKDWRQRGFALHWVADELSQPAVRARFRH